MGENGNTDKHKQWTQITIKYCLDKMADQRMVIFGYQIHK